MRNRADKRKMIFLYDKIHENVFVVQFTKFEQEINKICKLNKNLYDLKQFSKVWFETLIKFFFSFDYVSLNIKFNIFMKNDIMIDYYLCKWFNFYKIRPRDYFLIENCFKWTIRDEWFKFVHLLSWHDDFQKSTSQIIDSESKCLR